MVVIKVKFNHKIATYSSFSAISQGMLIHAFVKSPH